MRMAGLTTYTGSSGSTFASISCRGFALYMAPAVEYMKPGSLKTESNCPPPYMSYGFVKDVMYGDAEIGQSATCTGAVR